MICPNDKRFRWSAEFAGSQRFIHINHSTQSVSAMSWLPYTSPNLLMMFIHSDYPDFYKKLYALFDRNLMHVKYRSRFFRLVDLFLASR